MLFYTYHDCRQEVIVIAFIFTFILALLFKSISIGGTVDINVHRKKSNGCLKELCHASGGDCGGMSIDNAFTQMIVKIFGAPLITVLKQKDPEGYLDILRKFEIIKRTIETDTIGKVNFTIPRATIN